MAINREKVLSYPTDRLERERMQQKQEGNPAALPEAATQRVRTLLTDSPSADLVR